VLCGLRGSIAFRFSSCAGHLAAAAGEDPTFGEIGLPGYTVTGWFGLDVPKGTPKDVIAKIHSETVKALADPGLRERLLQQGAEPGGMAPDAYAKFVRDETVRWSELARGAAVKPEQPRRREKRHPIIRSCGTSRSHRRR
jgi:hypothetical protein